MQILPELVSGRGDHAKHGGGATTMLKDAAPKAKPRTTSHARKLRRQMPLPEVICGTGCVGVPEVSSFAGSTPPVLMCSTSTVTMRGLRSRSMAKRIREEMRRRSDAVRDAWLARAGIATVRIPAREVLANLDGVLAHVAEHAIARLPLHHPAAPAGPPPRGKLEED